MQTKSIICPDGNRGIRGEVYFARSKAMDLVKIGTSGNPETRILAVTIPLAGNPIKVKDLELIGIVHGSRSSEVTYHERLRRLREVTEWFRWEEPLITFVESIPLGPCDACISKATNTLLSPDPSLKSQLDATRRKAILSALERHDTNVGAARALGISRSYLIALRKELGI